MKTVICDRCGKICDNNEYYTIEFEANNSERKALSSDAAKNNTANMLHKELKMQKMYCKDCKNKIEKFINADKEVIDALHDLVKSYSESILINSEAISNASEKDKDTINNQINFLKCID